MNNFFKKALLLSCAYIVLPSLSLAVSAEDGGRLLAKYDLNGDHQITQDEVMSKKLNVFRYLDANKDGAVEFSEYESMDAARRANLLKVRFAKIDGNADNRVTEAEYSQFLGKFSSIDSNNDGALSSEEMSSAKVTDSADSLCLLWFCFRTHLD